MPLLSEVDGRPWLLAAASPKEAQAIARGLGHNMHPEAIPYWKPIECGRRFTLLLTGVGKSNAAGAVARHADKGQHAGILNLGIGGALPGVVGSRTRLSLGHVIVATSSIFADEGVRTQAGFIDMGTLGFGPLAGVPSADGAESSAIGIGGSPGLVRVFEAAGHGAGVIATVSTCSGCDESAQDIVQRTGAVAEAMEGAAVGLAAARACGVDWPFIEVRVISNTTGDRASQRWDLHGALDKLAALSADL